MRSRFWLSSVFAIVVLFAPAAPPVSASGSDTWNRDIPEYARMNGVDEATAERRLALQPRLARLSALLEEREPESFAGLYVTHGADFSITLAFTHDAARLTSEYVGGTDLEPYSQARDAEYSAVELMRIRDDVAKTTGLPVSVDVKANRVVAETLVGDKSTRTYALSPAVLIKQVEHVRKPTYAYGGLSLSSGVCTSGFTIYYGSSTSNRGITTAGHCPTTLFLGGQALSYQNDALHSGDYDVQTQKLSGASYPNWVYDGLRDADTYYRPVRYKDFWVSQYVGEFVCKYGAVTHYGCGYIVSKTDPGCMGGGGSLYVKVDSDPGGTGYDLAQGGDSGGPWFANTTALGTTSCQQEYDAIYSTTGFVEHSSIHILTTP